jgi:hypothetical protein
MITKENFEKKYSNNMNNFANWEDVETALQSDEWEPVFSEFIFDKKDLDKHFTYLEMSNTYYPKKETFLDILEKCGIELCPISGNVYELVENVQQEIDVNPLLMKSDFDEQTLQKRYVSVKVTKCGRRLCGDGTYRSSGAQSAEHNYFDKAVAIWNKEESFSEGYKKKQYKDKKGKIKPIYFKYETYYKRKVCLDQLKMHALAIARTKAINAVCSTLAGLPTGFNEELLSFGCFGFVKFVRSKQYQNLFTMAKIEAIRKGNTKEIQDTSNQLFGVQQLEAPMKEESNETVFNTQETSPPPAPPVDKKTQIKNVLEQYYDENEEAIGKVPNAKDSIEQYIIKYNSLEIEELFEMLQKVENKIPGIKKIDHGITLPGTEVF